MRKTIIGAALAMLTLVAVLGAAAQEASAHHGSNKHFRRSSGSQTLIWLDLSEIPDNWRIEAAMKHGAYQLSRSSRVHVKITNRGCPGDWSTSPAYNCIKVLHRKAPPSSSPCWSRSYPCAEIAVGGWSTHLAGATITWYRSWKYEPWWYMRYTGCHELYHIKFRHVAGTGLPCSQQTGGPTAHELSAITKTYSHKDATGPYVPIGLS